VTRPRILRRRRLIVGMLMLGITAGAAVAAGGDPFQPSSVILQEPSNAYPFGTDELGRDVLTRVLHGAATSLEVALAPALLAAAIGTGIGLVAGYVGGAVDELLLKLMELILVVPRFLLALVAAALFGAELWLIVLVLAVTFWPHTARLVRAEATTLREREFVEALRALGASNSRILLSHILPNLVAPILVFATILIPQNVLLEAALSFLGIGVQPPTADWGAMIAAAVSLFKVAWWYMTFPGLALLLTVLAFNLVGDGLQDALAPKEAR
jgi:peptide/nickel transport system permease protein